MSLPFIDWLYLHPISNHLVHFWLGPFDIYHKYSIEIHWIMSTSILQCSVTFPTFNNIHRIPITRTIHPMLNVAFHTSHAQQYIPCSYGLITNNILRNELPFRTFLDNQNSWVTIFWFESHSFQQYNLFSPNTTRRDLRFHQYVTFKISPHHILAV